MAQSKTVHKTGRTRFAKLILAILEELTPLLQDILQNEISPTRIYNEVSNDKSLFKKLRVEQIALIHNAQNDGYKGFDITLLYTLLRNLKCLNVTAPTQGWGASQMPGNGETTLGDDIERIRLIRNKVVAHTAAPSLSKTESKEHWSEIAGIGKRMENLLGKTYLRTLVLAELRTIDTEMESIYLEKIKELADAEKSMKEMLQKVIKGDEALYVEETVRIETKNSQKRKFCEALTETSISTLNALKNTITEKSSESDIEILYGSIEDFIKNNKEDASQISWSQYLNELEQKIENYAQLKGNTMQILARHLKFILRLKKTYDADVEGSKTRLLLKLTFSSKRKYDLFMQDLQSGKIEKLTLDVFHYPPYLANFDLQVEDLTVQLADETADNTYCVEEKVTVEAKDHQKRKLTENFTDTSISIWKDMNYIVEATSGAEIEEQYKSIEEFVGENDDDASKLTSSPFWKILEQKSKEYSCLGKTCMQILTRHIRFLLKLKIIYGAEVEVSKGSFLLTFTFSSRRGYGLFRQDFQRGEIEKLILEVLVDPPYLANFDLQVKDLTVHLIDDTAETRVSLSHKTDFSATQISSITVPGVDGVFCICVVTSDRLWVSVGDGRLLQVDSAGHVTHDKLKFRIGRMLIGSHTVTEDGDLLFIDNDDEVCKLTSDGTVTTLLTTDWGASCIHSSRINGDILVGSDGRVTRYDRTGRKLQVIEKDDKGQRLYRTPIYITENQNGDILISDWGKRAVVVVDKSGRHRFDYTGRQAHFSPRGICTDVLGHVLVCDWLNDSVHLLDQDGQFLSLLLIREQHGIDSPTALCVDDQHNLYMGQDVNDTINVYKYLQVTDVK